MEALLVTVKDAGNILGLQKSKVYQMINSGDLKTAKIGRRTLVSTESIREVVHNAMRHSSR